MNNTVNINDTLTSGARSDAREGFMEENNMPTWKKELIEYLENYMIVKSETSNPNVLNDEVKLKLMKQFDIGHNVAVRGIILGLKEGFQIDNLGNKKIIE